ncbi:conjugative transposon protein TraN [Flavobacterium beibuense]|uniref:Conjugative transposon protein TraN n=1 Tax=Flavobacterium beibuense TaxID=657326 RepID=A0A444WEN5_9FLAO|nr:conjugative transposon protein TraN [Flavobacterium beibuense]RYJ44313.1 Conjugative transposon protein TraN [Flavobacterium beibuense]
MKFIQLLLIAMLAFACPIGYGQQRAKLNPALTQDIAIAYSKTTTLVFPFAVSGVDRGSQHILVQKVRGMENVLQIKAAQQGFADTNLTVFTSDGKLYCFAVCYDESPDCQTYTFPDMKTGNLIQFSSEASNEKALLEAAEHVFHIRKRINGITEHKYGITLSITGLFIHDDLIYYRMRIDNETNISYDIDQLRFFVRDKKRSKRTASQELEIYPVAMHRLAGKIPAQSGTTFVSVLPKFTIPDKKNLVIQLVENKGGRHLELDISNRKLEGPSVLKPLLNPLR